MLGVYQAVDPSTYSDVYPENPDPRIKEIADLMTEWYRLFIDMRYINAEDVVFAPHEHIRIDTTKAAEIGLTKDVVDLYQMLPYLAGRHGTNWNFGSDGGEFLMWGEFLGDMRGPGADWWCVAVDPFYGIDIKDAADKGWDDEDGPYMRPWYVTLTDCGNHGSIMILDTKTYHMWFIEQQGGSADPAFSGRTTYTDVELSNKYDLAQFPSRPAVEFLRDMISRFRTLEWLPGGLYAPTDKKYKAFKDLYRECGWPSNFNPLLFDRKRRAGGKKYSYWARTRSPTAEKKSYAALDHLYHLMARARTRMETQIHIVDATYRLGKQQQQQHDDNKELQSWEEEGLVRRKRDSENYLSNPGFELEKCALRIELEYWKEDLEALRLRSGVYATLAWAGVSDEEIARLYRKAVERDRVGAIEVLLRDPDARSREEREFKEGKEAAARTPVEAWENMKVDEEKMWEEPGPVERWSILGSGCMTVDLKTVLDEDLGLDELEKRIVFVLERQEDRSWKGQRIWRNEGGRVAVVVDGLEKQS